MSRAESHDVGGEGREAGSSGLEEGCWASHEKGEGGLLVELDDEGDTGLSFKVMVWTKCRCHTLSRHSAAIVGGKSGHNSR
jgi:hypothetical protein